MKAMIPGLVICAALLAVGSGLAVFSGSERATNVWDGVFIVSTLVFLALFVTLLAGKAAATIGEHVKGEETGTVEEEARAARPGERKAGFVRWMKRDSRSAQVPAMPEGQTCEQERAHPSRCEASAPRKDRQDGNQEPNPPRPHRRPP